MGYLGNFVVEESLPDPSLYLRIHTHRKADGVFSAITIKLLGLAPRSRVGSYGLKEIGNFPIFLLLQDVNHALIIVTRNNKHGAKLTRPAEIP